MPHYYELLGVFETSGAYQDEITAACGNGRRDQIGFVGIGIDTLVTDEGEFVSSVYDGLPAAEAGVRVGDRLIDVDGIPFHPVRSFAASGRPTGALERSARTQRRDAATCRYDLVFWPARRCFTMRSAAVHRSLFAALHKIGYVHVWSYAGQKYQDELAAILRSEEWNDVDALILDLRDGYGGASPEFLSLFDRTFPTGDEAAGR